MADLAEEVARFHGYNKIPPPCSGETTGRLLAGAKLEQTLGSVCRACGYDEIITYSFISPPTMTRYSGPPTITPARASRSSTPWERTPPLCVPLPLPSMLEILT